jgi:hypothetical protein
MKAINGLLFFVLVLVLGACDTAAIKGEYALDFPALPAAWQEMLGNARWRLIWTDDQGTAQVMETEGEASIAVVSEWASPVLAFPYWPGRGILPGEMRPAGAIFPFDVRGDRLQLSWKAGPEAWFYRELAAARNAALTGAGTDDGAAAATAALDKRRPEYFDWPRFRSLMDSDAIPAAVRADPWKADWRDVAIRTVQSGFDRRRITGQAAGELLAPGSELGSGPFAGPSPFARPLLPEPGLGYRFAVTNRSDTYVSSEGVLRVSGKNWIYHSLHAP